MIADSQKPVNPREQDYIEVKLPDPEDITPESVQLWRSAASWNAWRQSLLKEKKIKIRLDTEGQKFLQTELPRLSDCNFSNMNLRNFDLRNKEADGADFSEADLRGADFTGSDLRRAKFNGANLTGATMAETKLSGAVLDEETIFERIKSGENVTIGINGIYVRRKERRAGEEQESAALMTLTPAGDSMKGNNAESVVENLSHSRKLHTSSIVLSAVVVTIVSLDTTTFKMTALEGIELPIGMMVIFSATIALIYQVLVLTHLRDAADGATYLQSREDAMKVGLFPWGLTSYAGRRRVARTTASLSFSGLSDRLPDWVSHRIDRLLFKGKKALWMAKESFPGFTKELIRFMSAFHSLLFLVTGVIAYNRKYDRYGGWLLFKSPKSLTFLALFALLLITSFLIYLESRRFRRPIVFDMQTQKASRNEMANLVESVAEQLQVTRRLASFIETAIPRYQNLGDQLIDRLPDGHEIVLRRIPGGVFDMGSDDSDLSAYPQEKLQHEVWIRPFWISQYEVTQQLWKSVMGNLPDELLRNKNFINLRFPVVRVSWEESSTFCQKLNRLLGISGEYGYRLPTEAEWEYAARAESKSLYCFGNSPDDLGQYAWFSDNSEVEITKMKEGKPEKEIIGRPHEVGKKLPNKYGLYDMHGNVWEWCQDHWHSRYTGAPNDGSTWLEESVATDRVVRGGCWYDNASYCRSAFRRGLAPGGRNGSVGFRLSRTLP